ncbi:MAG TPA: SCP2 sterol-binding domain-containing protein [Gammaproteobacteria bacterium]|nr:SCP2 sterol-binding domain-containing protein [Gammaproteobacteria bacterium]
MILSSLINRILDRDPEKSERLAKYNGKIIQLELLPIALNLYLIIENTHLNITHESNIPADAIIRVITHKDIDVTGDLVFLQDFKNRLSEIDPDWEEGLAQLIGDPLAHQIGNFFRQANQTQREFRTQFGRNITEYLQEETDCLPTREETEDFYKAVDKLYLDTERLDARIALLDKTNT